MKKKLIIIIGAIALIIVALALNNALNKQDSGEKLTVKIGVTLPLTGDVSVLGQSAKDAITMAKEEIENTKYNYEFIFEDDQFKPAIGATIANKFISVDKVSAILSFGSPVGNVVNPIAEKMNITHINFFASDTKVADGKYNFLHYTPPYKDTELFVQELNKRGIKKLVIFEVGDNPGAAAITKALEKSIQGTDIEIVSRQMFNTGTRDFRTLIQNVKDLDSDIFVLQASSPELETIYKQMKELKVNKPVTSIETFEFSNEIGLFEGSWYINAADPQKWFVDKFVSKYNYTPKFGAPNAYDAVKLAVKAIEKAGNGKEIPSNEEINNAMSEIKSFDGAMGDNLIFDENGQLISEAVLRTVQNGMPVTISK